MDIDAPFVAIIYSAATGRIEKWKEENQIGEQEEEEEATLAREAHSHMRSSRSLYSRIIVLEDRMHSSPKGLPVGVKDIFPEQISSSFAGLIGDKLISMDWFLGKST